MRDLLGEDGEGVMGWISGIHLSPHRLDCASISFCVSPFYFPYPLPSSDTRLSPECLVSEREAGG